MRRRATSCVVMIDLKTEHVIPIRRVPDYLENRGAKRPHVSAVYRWALSGLNGIKLETIRVGSVLHTSQEALDRWTRHLTVAGGSRS